MLMCCTGGLCVSVLYCTGGLCVGVLYKYCVASLIRRNWFSMKMVD